MGRAPTISIDPDEIERLRELLPQDEGAFCRGDVMSVLSLPMGKADWLLKSLRQKGLIEPAGKVDRIDAWGDGIRVHGYRFTTQKKGGDKG